MKFFRYAAIGLGVMFAGLLMMFFSGFIIRFLIMPLLSFPVIIFFVWLGAFLLFVPALFSMDKSNH